jgi:hypothetical protein
VLSVECENDKDREEGGGKRRLSAPLSSSLSRAGASLSSQSQSLSIDVHSTLSFAPKKATNASTISPFAPARAFRVLFLDRNRGRENRRKRRKEREREEGAGGRKREKTAAAASRDENKKKPSSEITLYAPWIRDSFQPRGQRLYLICFGWWAERKVGERHLKRVSKERKAGRSNVVFLFFRRRRSSSLPIKKSPRRSPGASWLRKRSPLLLGPPR